MTPKPVEFSRFLAFLQEQTRRVSLRRCRTEKLDHRQRRLLCAHRERRKQCPASLRAAIWVPKDWRRDTA